MRTLERLVVGAVVGAALLGVVVLTLPQSLGGATSYVGTHGTSMEPRFHTGDLAMIRASDSYRVGDVVAYHSDLLDTTVMHRIVAVRDGHYTFQGDNNSWLDPETPTEDRLIGQLMLRVPHGSIWLQRLSSPTGVGLLALGILLTGGLTTRTCRKKRRNRTVSRHAHRARTASSAGTLTSKPSSNLSIVALAAAALGLVGLGLGLFAWTGPVTRPVTAQQPSDRAVTFSYTATVPPSAAYDDTAVTSPEPVFRALANSVEVRYRYQGEPGTVSVTAELSTASGWHSTVLLSDSHRFADHTYDGHVHLDLDSLVDRADRAAKVIGLPADQLTVTVRPHFTSPRGDFSPELPLTLTPTELTPAADASLRVEDSATVAATTQAPRTLSIVGHGLTAGTARPTALLLLCLAVLLGGLVAFLARVAPPATEATAFRRRHHHLLVPVEPVPAPPGRPIVDVTDLATLARLAERYGQLVLHWSRGDVETFLVQDEGTTYRFRVTTCAEDTRIATGGSTRDDRAPESESRVPASNTHTAAAVRSLAGVSWRASGRP